MGLGFNGGQLLGLAIGGCFCNDLQYVAHDMDVSLTSVEVEVTVTLEGNPLIATHAKVRVAVETADPSRANSIIHRAREISTVSNSLKRGVAVEFSRAVRSLCADQRNVCFWPLADIPSCTAHGRFQG